MALPIIVYQEWNPTFLFFFLAQAKHTNPDSTIYLLGDESNAHHSLAEHAFFRDYFEEASAFEKAYVHMSENRYGMELRCFQRWFVIKEFAIKHNLDKFYSPDSDVMIYCDITEEQKKFSDADFTSPRLVTFGETFINNIETIESFCSFLFEMYEDPALLEELKSEREGTHPSRSKGNITDMTAVQYYIRSARSRVCDSFEIIDDSLFDDNINCVHGFEPEAPDIQRKKVYWIKNQPYGQLQDSKKLIRFNTLHFQGVEAKALMKPSCTVKNVGSPW